MKLRLRPKLSLEQVELLPHSSHHDSSLKMFCDLPPLLSSSMYSIPEKENSNDDDDDDDNDDDEDPSSSDEADWLMSMEI